MSRCDISSFGLPFQGLFIQFLRVVAQGEAMGFPLNSACNARVPRFSITAPHPDH